MFAFFPFFCVYLFVPLLLCSVLRVRNIYIYTYIYIYIYILQWVQEAHGWDTDLVKNRKDQSEPRKYFASVCCNYKLCIWCIQFSVRNISVGQNIKFAYINQRIGKPLWQWFCVLTSSITTLTTQMDAENRSFVVSESFSRLYKRWCPDTR